MKATKLLFAFCILCCALIACKGKNPEAPSEEQEKELKEKALELATFLTTNYTERDRIFFKTENGTTENFVVLQNYFNELSEIIEAEEGEECSIYVAGYKMQTVLQSKNTIIMVQLFHMLDDEKQYTDGTVVINQQYSTSRSNITAADDYITIKIDDNTCILKKDIGITKIYSSTRSWELVR